ncbi:MAG TPA: VWA domain-containing protein [Leptospiraceae bacterium]|nr:VWA domain-containing protein [Leptospiraceae bacterium]HMW03987.1 VWA domain-containing protein [Leptospiraceae bacterium]HMX30877.1 VWA domain-containing protein [Leptospiraceae bacterium]HMY29981.1 VWA domain-containing protein [Leptospiraceae bacterium]HMZ66699.1 VWA domain-containing protein [Leptospiraceae bacterium]
MIKIILLLLTILLNTTLFAREVTFLPAYVIGEEPPALKKKDNVSSGISELIAYYANENFLIEVSDPDKVKNYVRDSGETMDRKPSKSLLNGVCEEFGSDYIVKTEINFDSSISILSEVYNCRGKVIGSNESLFKENFYSSIEKHTKRTLNFLVPKNKSDSAYDLSGEEEIIFLFDMSGSLSREVKGIFRYILSITGSKNLSLGAVFVSESSIKILKPSLNHDKLKEELGRIKQGGDVGIDRITQGLVKIRSELGLNRITKKKMIIVTDAKSSGTGDYGYLSAVQAIKELGYNTFIVSGSFFDYKSMSLHKKAAKLGGNTLQQITHFQKVGTTKGYKTIYLNDRTIYYDESEQVNPREIDLKEMVALDEGRILSKVDFPHPDNMSDVFERVQGTRLIERQSISSNADSVVEKIVQSKGSISFIGSKILIKTGHTSFWITLKNTSEDLENQDIVIKASFVRDEFSANGFINIPAQTEIYKESVPKLLVLEPAQIRNFLKSNSVFTCFVQGRVVEVK